jgi:hypothetical protein
VLQRSAGNSGRAPCRQVWSRPSRNRFHTPHFNTCAGYYVPAMLWLSS